MTRKMNISSFLSRQVSIIIIALALMCFHVDAIAADLPDLTTVASQVRYYSINDGMNFSRSLTPTSTTVGSGTISQTANPDGTVQLTISNIAGYADDGFYLPLGTLGGFDSLVIGTAPGSDPVYVNIWFDVDNSGEFFTWDGNVLSGLGNDSYILGPNTVQNVLTVDANSTFNSLIPGGGNYTVAQLKNGAASGITSATKIAIWVGIATGGGSLNATVSSLSITRTDTRPPGLSFNPVKTPTNQSSQTITGTMDAGAIIIVTCPTASVSPVSYPTTTTWQVMLTNMTEGNNTINITATDQEGHVSNPIPVTITLDTMSPIVTISSLASSMTNTTIPLLTYTTADAGMIISVLVTVDGNTVSKVSGDHLDILTSGLTHTVRVEATDAAGNTGFSEVAFAVDTAPPFVSINPLSSPIINNSQTISGSMEAGALITVAANTTASAGPVSYPTTTAWSCTISGLVVGSNNITVTATDAAGNTATASIVLDPNLVALWHMDGNWLDSSGNGNDGTAMNGVTFTTDARVGPYSGSFDGSNDYVTLVNAQSLRPTVFTIEAWVKAASSVTASSVIFSSFDYLSGHDAGFHLGLNYNVGDGKVWLDIANNAGQRDRVLSSMGEYNDNTWHQVVGTYDGSYIKVYIDGVLKGNLAWAYSPVYTASNNVSIGARSYANTTDMYFTGRIDEAALYNRALNADEVTGLYNLTAPLVTILSPTAGITNNNKPLLSYTVSSGVVMVKVDGNIVSTVSGSNLDLVSDGTHTVRVEAVNSAGVMVFAEVVFTVDTVPPAFGIDPVVTPTHSGSQTITGTRESGTVISVSVNTSATIGTVIYPTLTTWSCDLSSLTPGVNNVTVTARDAAGNSPSITTSIERLAFSITGVGVNANILDVSQGGTTNIFFTIDAPATVTLKVFAAITDPTMSPIYQTSRNCSSAGAQLFTWDGKNNAGNVVPDEAYLYVLEASDGAVSATYNPSAPTGTGTVTCSQDSFNPYKNDPMTISYSVSPAARVDIKITSGLNTFTIMNSIAHAVGSYTYDWDGRDQNGAIVSDGSIASCFITRLLRENHIVTTGNTPKITFVRTDPYDIHLSYGQFTRIKYNLSGAANVSVQLISPSGTTMTLIDNQPQAAGLNEVDWKGFADPSERLLTVKEDGVFTFLVRAVNPVTGSQSQSRGTLTIGY